MIVINELKESYYEITSDSGLYLYDGKNTLTKTICLGDFDKAIELSGKFTEKTEEEKNLIIEERNRLLKIEDERIKKELEQRFIVK